MNWLLPALIAPAIYAISIFIDKYLVEHKVKDSRAIPVFTSAAAGVFGTILWLALGMPTTSGTNMLLLLLSGLFAVGGLMFYFYALTKSHASYINAVFQMMPVFLLLIAVFVLGEQLNTWQTLGFFAIFGAIMGLSLEKQDTSFKLNEAFFAMLLASLLFAVSAVIIKFTAGLTELGPILIFESWGLACGGILLFALVRPVRKAFMATLRSVEHRTIGIMFFNEGLFIASKALTFLAIVLGPVSLVGVLEGTQVFYGLVYGVVLTLLFPAIFHDGIAKRNMAQKIMLSALLFAGVWLISA